MRRSVSSRHSLPIEVSPAHLEIDASIGLQRSALAIGTGAATNYSNRRREAVVGELDCGQIC
jgi:hypothetical protein